MSFDRQDFYFVPKSFLEVTKASSDSGTLLFQAFEKNLVGSSRIFEAKKSSKSRAA